MHLKTNKSLARLLTPDISLVAELADEIRNTKQIVFILGPFFQELEQLFLRRPDPVPFEVNFFNGTRSSRSPRHVRRYEYNE